MQSALQCDQAARVDLLRTLGPMLPSALASQARQRLAGSGRSSLADPDKARSLAFLVSSLPAAERPQAIVEVLDELEVVGSRVSTMRLLARLNMTGSDSSGKGSNAADEDQVVIADVLTHLLSTPEGGSDRSLTAKALRACRAIIEPAKRSPMLARMVPHVSEKHRECIIRHCLSIFDRVDAPDSLQETLRTLTPYLAGSLLVGAFFKARSLLMGRERFYDSSANASLPQAQLLESAKRLWGASIQEMLVGSSRVDLQACKLEYSIVSPK